jgi:hypothetical protein
MLLHDRSISTAAVDLLLSATLSAQGSGPAGAGVCLLEGHLFVGEPPVETRRLPYARGTRQRSSPDFPPLPPGVRYGSSWMGEVLIDRAGQVAHVWVLRDATVAPFGVGV